MATSEATTTVWQAFYDVLRAYDMKVMFGNPGSTEQPMLMNFPSDFKYVFGLQEATVTAMADGYAQATRKPAVVSLHGAAGTGNAMNMIFGAFINKTPLLLIAGQQHRDMLVGEPFLTSRDETMLARPYVKWAYQPPNAQAVPATVIRAIATAMMPPAGPVHLTIPLNDWFEEIKSVPIPRLVSTRYGPDPEQLASFATQLKAAKKPVFVFGPEVDRSLAWLPAVQLAEMLDIPVYEAPGADRTPFPVMHPLYRGPLPMAQLQLSEMLEGHDLIFVVGAEIWRYYPYIPGPIVPPGSKVLQISNDPHDISTALIGDSLLSDAKLALQALVDLFLAAGVALPDAKALTAPKPEPLSGMTPMTARDVFATIALQRPAGSILLQESPSNAGDLLSTWPTMESGGYITMAHGGLGWDSPAAVGVALAQKLGNTGRKTVLVMGDGSFNYSPQSVYTAVQEQVPLIILVLRNEQYAVLKEFAVVEKTPGVPALDLPGLNATALAQAYGCPSQHVATVQELERAWAEALKVIGPVMIEVTINKELRPLVAQVSTHPR